ncbi:hypothetical protein M0811_07380 [Anaeramoeba ignava]|uniref:Sm domain-containing protein n=1 Tax=Anaeramoeba ignava TaxID=1746090 RepID=A0A9Q0R6B6_ANAIG|nr:hypothetical protein M0811_12558 [Anaeramoeba ignava]KAJ5075410.1 hypothetical protein M0811_07380 [Anaeramoeba ignava]
MNSEKEKSQNQNLIEKAKTFLGKSIMISLKDQRRIAGTFECFDKQGNIVVSNAAEESKMKSGDFLRRKIGNVIIPYDFIENCFAQKNL